MGRSQPRRRSFPAYPAAAVCAALAGLALAGGIYRDGFDGKQTAWVKGGANVPFTEDAHEITTESAHTFPASEYLRLRVEPTPGNLNPFVHYRYATPPAPVSVNSRVLARMEDTSRTSACLPISSVSGRGRWSGGVEEWRSGRAGEESRKG